MLDPLLQVVLMALLLVPFSSHGRNTFVILDRRGDLTPNWSSTNCTYAEIYSDFNRLQCRVTTHPSRHVVEELREFPRKRGFWTPCTQTRCEIGYELKPRSPGDSRIRVNVQGFLSGKGGVEVMLIRNHTAAVEVGKLKVLDHWSQETFFIPNVTTDSVLKILISQPSYPDDLALLDRITIEYNPHQPASFISVNKYSLLQPKIRSLTTEEPKVMTPQVLLSTTPESSTSNLITRNMVTTPTAITKTPLTMTEMTEMSTPISNVTLISRKDGKEQTILMKDEAMESGSRETGVLGMRMTEQPAPSLMSNDARKDEGMKPSREPEVVPTQSLTENGVALPISVPQSSPPSPSMGPESVPEGGPAIQPETKLSTSDPEPEGTRAEETSFSVKKSSGVTESILEPGATVSKNEAGTEATVAISRHETTSPPEPEKIPESSMSGPEGTAASEPESENTSATLSIPEPEGTPSSPEPEAEKTSASSAAVPKAEATDTDSPPAVTVSIPKPEGTTPASEPEPEKTDASASIPEPAGTVSASNPEPEATASVPEPEATASVPEPESTASVSEPEATASVPEPEATVSVPEPESTVPVPEPESTASVPEPEATVSVPEPEATASVPEPEATASVPEPEATASVPIPEPEATAPSSIPEPEPTASASIPQQGTSSASKPGSEKTATEATTARAPEPEPEKTPPSASIPEPEPTSPPIPENSGSPTAKPSPEPEPTGTIPTKLDNNTMAESYSSGRSVVESSAPWGLYIGIPVGAILFVAILGVGYFMKKKRSRGSVTP